MEAHDVLAYQISAQSDQQFYWKCVKTAEPIRGQEMAGIQQLTRTKTPAFWAYLMITHTIESYWIPSQKKTKSKLQI